MILGITAGCAHPDPIPVPSAGPNLLPGEVLAKAGAGTVLEDVKAKTVLGKVKEFFRLSQEMGESLWPGWSLEGLPLAARVPPDRMLLFHHPDPMPGMQLVAQTDLPSAVFIGPCAPDTPDEGLAHFRSTLTLFISPDTTYPRFIHLGALEIMMIHEEPSLQLVDEWLPLLFPERNLLRGLEARFLKEAIEEQELEGVGAFLSVRAERRLGLSPETIALEEKLEQGEGMAFYIKRKAKELLHGTDVPVPLDEVIRLGYGTGGMGFAVTGMAQAVLLDRWMPDWKEKLMAEEGLTVTELLARIAPEGAGRWREFY